MRLLITRIAMTLAIVMTVVTATTVSAGAQASPVASQSSAAGVTIFRDVKYGEADGVDLLLDVYVPGDVTAGPYPAVVVIHGGGWGRLSKNTMAQTSERLAEEGFVAFNVDYRLAPPDGQWHAPAAAEDVRQAVRWVRANAATYDADPALVGALGSSAGANLALLLATTGEPGSDKVDAAVSWSGPTDLLALADYRGNEMVPTYIGCDPAVCPDRWEAASPLAQVDPGDSPMFIANSTDELTPLGQATRMADALEDAGVPYQLRLLEGSVHARGFEDEVWDESVAFLRTYLTGESS
jgi:acetyl esterase